MKSLRMKFKIFSNAVCLTVISSLLCSCATETGTRQTFWKAPNWTASQWTMVVLGAMAGPGGIGVAMGDIGGGHDSRQSEEAGEVLSGSAKTEYLQAGSSGKPASTSNRVEKVKPSKLASDSKRPATQYQGTRRKTALTPTPTKESKSAKFSSDSNGTQYLVQ